MRNLRFVLASIFLYISLLPAFSQAEAIFMDNLRKAQMGDAAAQYYVGFCYYNGDGIARDATKAFEWFLKAAEQGYVKAQCNVGVFYSSGTGTPRDYTKAFEWFLKAAEQGYVSAQFNVANCYSNGKGVAKDIHKAFEWYVKAGQHGDADAQKQVGYCYSYGYGTVKDLYKALEWYQMAAVSGNVEAQTYVGNSYYTGDCVEKNPQRAFEWYTRAAEKGSVEAQYRLGTCYYLGAGVEKDYAKAFEWLQKSAEKGYTGAIYDVAICYYKGHGVTKDDNKALELLNQALNKGDIRAMQGIAMLNSQQSEENNLADNNNAAQESSVQASQDNETVVEETQTETPASVEAPANDNLVASQNNDSFGQDTPIEESAVADVPSNDDQMPSNDSGTTVQATPSEGYNNNGNQPASINPENTFAVIIAEEDYPRAGDVPYAKNDGRQFKECCMKVLGLPERNIKYVENATLNDIIYNLDWLRRVLKAYNGEARAIFYYAGHGISDESDKTAYLLPVDGYASKAETGYALDELYKMFASVPSAGVTIFLDAAFSGKKREGGMIASARGIAIKSRKQVPMGNVVVFTAAQKDEAAYLYNRGRHGMFTYYLLDKLNETNGYVTLGELSGFVTRKVRQESVVINGKAQTPLLIPSVDVREEWQSWTLK